MSLLNLDQYLTLNHGRYHRQEISPDADGVRMYLTTHGERAATDTLHYHDRAHLSFVLSGGVIDKRRGSVSEKTAGDLMFFHAGESHASVYRGFPVRNINLELDDAFFAASGVSELAFGEGLKRNISTRSTLLRITREIATNDSLSPLSLGLLVSELADDGTLMQTRPVWLNSVIDLLNDNWDVEISVADLAAAAKVHPKTVSKGFGRFVGMSVGDYRRRLRIERSIPMIRDRGIPLTDVALACGFYDQSHFTRNFKQLTGYLPRQFRDL